MKQTLFLIVVGLVIAACAPLDPDPNNDVPDDILGTWELIFAQTPNGEVNDARLILDEDSVGGQGPCNTYGGSVRYGDESIMFSELFQTLRSCGSQIDSQEAAYMNALMIVDTYDINGDDLVLTGPEVELRFARA